MAVIDTIRRLYEVYETRRDCVKSGHADVKVLGNHGLKDYVQCLNCGERYYVSKEVKDSE